MVLNIYESFLAPDSNQFSIKSASNRLSLINHNYSIIYLILLNFRSDRSEFLSSLQQYAASKFTFESFMLVTFPVKNNVGNILQGNNDAIMKLLRKIETENEIETEDGTKIGLYDDKEDKKENVEKEEAKEKVEKKERETLPNLKKNRSMTANLTTQLPLLSERISKLTLLRRICQVTGLRILCRDYDFSSSSPFGSDDIVSLMPLVSIL